MPSLTCDWANEDGRVTRHQECFEPATERVRNVLGVNYYCKRHGQLVAMNEADWDRAEAEEFDA
jgi:hypothetical protein